MKISSECNNYIGTLDDKYHLIEEKDYGATSKLFKVIDINTGETKAAKIFNEGNDDEFELELDILESISELPNVIRYLSSGEGYLITKEKSKRKYIILEYAKGSLLKYRSSMTNISEDTCKFIFHEIILAIKSLHEIGLSHRDIKLDNMLFVGDEYSLKLCDFGYSDIFLDENDNKIELKDFVGSECHKAPEILSKKPYDGEKIDIFSAGVTLLSLVLGKFTFKNASEDDPLYSLIISKNYEKFWNKILGNKKLSDDFKDLYMKMVEYNPKERIDIDGILNSKWLSDIRNANEEKLKELKSKMINELKVAEKV